ncbi:MAG TPA: hypothetical protein VJ860_04150 [Polyangia bacterium]|jgi:hypothetical protein|nr:hypothetical protein [Polyangia bacterium]
MFVRLLGTVPLVVTLAGCSQGPVFKYDSRPIELQRAPTAPGGPALGATLAKVTLGSDTPLLLIDTGSLLSSLRRGVCPSPTPEPGTYTGDIQLLAASDTGAPLRASFRGVTLFDLCPGAVGDANTQAAGVVGGDILRNFSVALSLARIPRDPNQPTTMTIYSDLPASDSDLAANGYAVMRFGLRGNTAAATASGGGLPGLPSSRVMLRACANPPAFAPNGPAQVCKTGEVEVQASGTNLLLALSTGHGPLVLSADAWQRMGGQSPTPLGAGEPGLYSPLVTDPIAAHWVTVSRLALVDGDSGDAWPGACAELARGRRIEWTLANQNNGGCFQPCDVSGGVALPAAAYLEIGSDLPAAIVSDTSDLIGNFNEDFPSGAQVDGLIGAETLAGIRFEIDYVSQPQGRWVAACEPGVDRQTCWAAPRCYGLSGSGQTHMCFGLPPLGRAPTCPP